MKTAFGIALIALCMMGAAGNAPAQADVPPLALSLTGPLTANPAPLAIDAGALGTTYVMGVVSGLAFWQDPVNAGDKDSRTDIGNAQVFVQKADGWFQYFLQAGIYDLPALGTTYVQSKDAVTNYYGPLPQAYLKLVPADNFSVQVGKMPTLIGAENTFTFQNRNIQRGLLWNQTPGVTRAVQVNYATGPLAFSLALNDGFYSDRWSWLAGTATYTIDPSNAVTFYGAANLSGTRYSSAIVPLLQNNQQIYTLLYTYAAGPWVLQPYVQYSAVPATPELGSPKAATYSGALWLQYTFWERFSLPARFEYISATGGANLLYGPGSSAWSVTVTPTVTHGRLFARLEGSYVRAAGTAPGLAFGPAGNDTSQARLMAEAGVLF